MMASAIPLLLALTWGGTRYSWLSPQILGLIAVSFVLSLLFGWRLARAPEPFLPLTVLQQSGDADGHRVGVARRWACRSGSPSSCRCISRWCTG